MELFYQNMIDLAQRAGRWLMQPMTLVVERSDMLRELTFSSVVFRLTLAILLGGAIGLERGRKNRPAGFRTYMMVCMGSVLTMLLGQYTSAFAQAHGLQTDMTRIGAQVINGIGFLGAGTILVTEKQQVKGLTTAAGLWASACMGLALGAGFYECVMLAFLLIIMVVLLLPKIEAFLIAKSRNMDFYVEVAAIEGIHQVIACLKMQNVQIYDVDITRGELRSEKRSNAVFSVRLDKRQTHTQIMEQLSHIDTICTIKEL